MATGIAFNNTSGRAIISSSQFVPAFIGNATFTGVRQPDGYVNAGQGMIPGSGSPFYSYRINSVYPPMAFMQLTSRRFTVCSITNVGGNTWEIVVGGNDWSSPPTIKCFSRLSGPGASGVVGLRVRDSAGNRTWDSTEKMLTIRRRFDWSPHSDTSAGPYNDAQPLSGMVEPYLMACAAIRVTGRSWATVAGIARHQISIWVPGWSYFEGQLGRTSRSMLSYQYLDDSSPRSNTLPADRCYIIEGNDY